jgi:hypothetical protein
VVGTIGFCSIPRSQKRNVGHPIGCIVRKLQVLRFAQDDDSVEATAGSPLLWPGCEGYWVVSHPSPSRRSGSGWGTRDWPSRQKRLRRVPLSSLRWVAHIGCCGDAQKTAGPFDRLRGSSLAKDDKRCEGSDTTISLGNASISISDWRHVIWHDSRVRPNRTFRMNHIPACAAV